MDGLQSSSALLAMDLAWRERITIVVCSLGRGLGMAWTDYHRRLLSWPWTWHGVAWTDYHRLLLSWPWTLHGVDGLPSSSALSAVDLASLVAAEVKKKCIQLNGNT